jgi:hypothetical protein
MARQAVRWVLVGAMAVACHSSPAGTGEAQAKGAAMNKDDVTLDWGMSLAEGDKRLRIEYTVTNHGKDKIWVWDQVVTTQDGKLVARPDAISTKNGEQPSTVLFVRGRVQPDSRVNVEYVPGVRPLEPGKSLKGTAEVPLPLQAWLAYGAVQPLKGTPTQAVLEVQWFPGGHGTTPMPLADGSSLPKPAQPWSEAVALRGAARPIPTP